MVLEQLDPDLGPVYSIHALKNGVNNSAVAYRLYYAGETQKWSAQRRKVIIKASNRVKSLAAIAEREDTSGEESRSE